MPPPSSLSINEYSEQQRKIKKETKQIPIKGDELVKKTDDSKGFDEKEAELIIKELQVTADFEAKVGELCYKKGIDKLKGDFEGKLAELLYKKTADFKEKIAELCYKKEIDKLKGDFEGKLAELLYKKKFEELEGDYVQELNAEYEQKMLRYQKKLEEIILRYPYYNEAGCGTANPNPNCWHVGQPEHVPPSVIKAYGYFIRGSEKDHVFGAINSTISLSLDDRKTLISILISHGTTMLLNCEKLDDTFRSLGWAEAITILEFGETVFDDHDRLVKLIKRIRGLNGDPTLLMKFYQRRTECKCLTQISSEGRMRLGYCSNCYHPFDFEKLKKCSRCDVVHYCGKECQKSHWHNNHNIFCNDMKSKTVHDWDSLLECLSQQTYVSTEVSDFVGMLSYYRVN